MRDARPVFVGISIVLGFFGLAAWASNPTARYPLHAPRFCIDPNSPETTGFISPADILITDAAPPPMVYIPASLHSTGNGDVMDGLALLEPALLATAHFALLFSVDRGSQGGVSPDPGLVAAGFPFNAADQAAKHQQAADIFMATRAFTRGGPAAARRGGLIGPDTTDNNVLVINQGDAGGVDLELTPAGASPADPIDPNATISQVDDGMGTSASSPAFDGVPAGFLFSLRKGSPALGTLPHDPIQPCASGADIYVDFSPGTAGGEVLYATHRQLGLVCDDDIDGLIVFDALGDGQFSPGNDQVIFTLTPTSPSANGGAVLYTSFGGGVFTIWATPPQLGLAATDNVTLLDYVPMNNLDVAIKKWAIGYCRCIGDADCDGIVSLSDLAVILSAYGACAPATPYAERIDYDSSGCIDLPDIAAALGRYGTICPP